MGTKGCHVLGQEGAIKGLEGFFGTNLEVLGVSRHLGPT